MDDANTVINLAEVRRATDTTTSSDLGSGIIKQPLSDSAVGSPARPTAPQSSPAPPEGGSWHSVLIWGAIGILFTAIVGLAVMFHTESKELNSKINENQRVLSEKINETQFSLTKQIYEFERRLYLKLDTDKDSLLEIIEKQEDELKDLQNRVLKPIVK